MYDNENDNAITNGLRAIGGRRMLLAGAGSRFWCLGIAFALCGLTATAVAGPPFFSVDATSPTVTADGYSAAAIFENEYPDDGTPPPNLICRLPVDLGLIHADEVDAICRANLVAIVAPEIHQDGSNYVGNIFAWSIDRASVGKVSGDILCDSSGPVPSFGSPELTETTSNGASACGDVFAQMFDGESRGRLNLKLQPWDDSELEEYGGAFGAPDLDNLDALEIFGDCEDDYYFSLDPASAATHGVDPADVLQYSSDDGTFVVFRTAAELGLVPGDDIDAMQVLLWEPFHVAISLSRSSPSLVEPGTGFTWSAADIFLVGDENPFPGTNTLCDMPDNRCWISAEYLSLLPTDNIDAFFGGAGDPGEVLGYTGPGCAGDVDCDGDVDLADLAQLLAAYGTCAGDAGYSEEADIDHDGCVSLPDLAALLSNYGMQCP